MASQPTPFNLFPKGAIPLSMVLAAIVLILAPVTLLTYYFRRNFFPIKGRGWKLLVVAFLAMPVHCIIVLVTMSPAYQTRAPNWLFAGGFTFTFVTILVVYMFRAWRLLFAFKLTANMVELNECVEKGQFDLVKNLHDGWFLRYRHWLRGSRFGVLFTVTLLVFYLLGVVLILRIRQAGATGLASGILGIPPLIGALIAACGFRSFKGDGHFIKLELSVVGLVIVVLVLLDAVLFVIKRRFLSLGIVLVMVIYLTILLCSGILPVYESYKAQERDKKARMVENIDVFFKNLLTDPFGAESFLKFARSEFSIENVLFWRDIQKVHDLRTPTEMQIHFRRVYSTYVLDSSTIQVNISGESRSELDKAFDLLGKWGEGNDYKTQLRPWLLVQNEVFILMKKDSLRRYLHSPDFVEYQERRGTNGDLEMANRKVTEHLSYRPKSSHKSSEHSGSNQYQHKDQNRGDQSPKNPSRQSSSGADPITPYAKAASNTFVFFPRSSEVIMSGELVHDDPKEQKQIEFTEETRIEK